MIKELHIGLGLDTYSDPYSNGESVNTVYDNIELDSHGVEKKRECLQEHVDSEKLTNMRVSKLFYWVENNLLNNRAWIVYDKNSGKIKIMEG